MKLVWNIAFATVAAALAGCSPQGATNASAPVPASTTTATKPAVASAPAPAATASASSAPTVAAEAQPPSMSPSPPAADAVNLLAASNGGQLLVAANDNWKSSITGNDADVGNVKTDDGAIYAFKDERPATFKSFSILIPAMSDSNPGEMELLVSSDSPTGTFRSLGKFKVLNAKLMKNPYQQYDFPETTAKYFKIKFLSNTGYPGGKIDLHQIRLTGKLAQ
jgi:hypothetical protein